MVAIGYSTLKRNSAFGVVMTVALAGCTSVEYTPQHQLTAAHGAVPAAKPQATQVGYAASHTQAAGTVATAQAASGTTAQPMPTTVAAKTSRVVPQAETAQARMMQTAEGQTALAPTTNAAPAASAAIAAVAPQSGAQAMSVAYAEMPLTDEVTAIQSVVPTKRPDRPFGADAGPQLAYAAMPSRTQARAATSLAMMDFDTRPMSEIESRMAPTDDEAEAPKGGPRVNDSMMKKLISKYASLYQVPEALVHRVVRRESTYNPRAYAHGNYGLMQIRYNTAKSMGYSGPASGLFDAETNLKYAVKYLRGAWITADNNHDNAVRLYASGYYYTAKRKGLLNQVQ